MKRIRVLIMGAAGRDFHNFNVHFRDNEMYEVVAFTATQIPNIEGRTYPAELAGRLYPNGIPIYPEDELENIVRREKVDQVVFAYSDINHVDVMHKASRALSAGADFRLMGPESTMLRAKVPVVAICAVRTGVGKSQTTRRVSDLLQKMGYKVVAVRHPMPYGDLAKQACQRFATYEDLDRHECTIEEREEYEPHIDRGVVVYAGVDYGRILAEAEKEADVILWDGGNNDMPFYKPDFMVTLADPHRPGHETTYHPGETNFRMADLIIINKVDTADPADVARVREAANKVNPRAEIIEAASPVIVDRPEEIKGKRVLVIEDGPTLTHGEMGYGAGVVAAEKYGAKELVDPKPYAVGSIKATLERWPHKKPLLPAMGYGKTQIRELQETIDATDADMVLVGTPIDLSRVITIRKPHKRVRYELEEMTGPSLAVVLKKALEAAGRRR